MPKTLPPQPDELVPDAGLPDVDRPLPTVPRSFRTDESLWDEVLRRAKADGLSASEVIRHYLRGYVSRP